MLKRIIKSPSVQAAVIYGIGGLGFAVGNILLARALSTAEFAWVALILAIVQLTYSIGPLGADTLVNRYRVNASPKLLKRILISSAIVATVSSVTAWKIYGFSVPLLMLTAVLCVASSINIVGASIFRSRGKFLESMTLTQGHNVIFVVVALATIGASKSTAFFPLAVITLAYVLSAITGWVAAFRLVPLDDSVATGRLPWHEGRTILVTGIAVIVLIQLERLAIPKLLDYESLAIFAILASIAGSPYRVLQMGVNFTLLPRLRQATDVNARREIVKSEAITAALIVCVASLLVWLFTRPLVDWFLEGRYHLSDGLVGSAILAGIAKVISSFTCTGVTALGDTIALYRLGVFSWLAVAVGTVGAVLGASNGLVGIVLGVASGWIFLAVVALAISKPYFRKSSS